MLLLSVPSQNSSHKSKQNEFTFDNELMALVGAANLDFPKVDQCTFISIRLLYGSHCVKKTFCYLYFLIGQTKSYGIQSGIVILKMYIGIYKYVVSKRIHS